GSGGAPGYISASGLLSGHVFALLILLVWLVVYGLTFYLDHPTAERSAIVPALAYLLALLTLPTWMFSGAAFFLDRYRVPALVVPALLLVLAFTSPTDHFFDTQAPPASAGSPCARASTASPGASAIPISGEPSGRSFRSRPPIVPGRSSWRGREAGRREPRRSLSGETTPRTVAAPRSPSMPRSSRRAGASCSAAST